MYSIVVLPSHSAGGVQRSTDLRLKAKKSLTFENGYSMVDLPTALVVCNGPLLYDFTIIYKGSLDGTVLVFVIATGKL